MNVGYLSRVGQVMVMDLVPDEARIYPLGLPTL